MIQASRKTADTGSGTTADALRGVLSLTWLEVRRSRRSHLGAVAAALVMGLAAPHLLAAASDAGLPPDGTPAVILLNFVFVLWAGVLPRTGAWAPGDYSGTARQQLSSEGHLAFLRSLPLTVAQVVASRALATVFRVLALSAAFLVPFYLLSETLRVQLGAGGLLLFAVFWVGVALAFESVGLFTEMGLGGWAGFMVYLALMVFLGGFASSLGNVGLNVVEGVIGLVQERGALPALLALLFGGGLFALSRWATERRVRRRERSA